jgi:DNA-binding LytR/AlgR family response regulator
MNVIIVEDEQLAAQRLLRTLKEIVPDVTVSGIISSVEKAVNYFNQPFDAELIFMDIQLEDGICFEIFERTHLSVPIIFTTAFDQYTLLAFKQNSIDYLLKPINADDLKNAIDKYQNLHQKFNYSQIQHALDKLVSNNYKERFLIKLGEHYKSIGIETINCFYSCESCTFIFTNTARSYAIDYSLDKIENLIDPSQFYRINRNMIVRIDAIEKIFTYSSNRLKICINGFDNNTDAIVSRDRVKSFKQWMDR